MELSSSSSSLARTLAVHILFPDMLGRDPRYVVYDLPLEVISASYVVALEGSHRPTISPPPPRPNPSWNPKPEPKPVPLLPPPKRRAPPPPLKTSALVPSRKTLQIAASAPYT
ncbi:uncharacterized proline-rich protein-like [Triticum urartu]|uniref:uncharacterized proline-rich protein-like n=1 Tax=Triticum urartu TaxID=4572 RepID=UPI00204347E5|nr:uncharacterized proline-rich protein-like [Triticum urartu]